MTVKGFESLPTKRLVPNTIPIDHSATLSLLVLCPKYSTYQIHHETLLVGNSCFVFFKCWLRNPVPLKLVPPSVALIEFSSITLDSKRIELMTSALLARRPNQLS